MEIDKDIRNKAQIAAETRCRCVLAKHANSIDMAATELLKRVLNLIPRLTSSFGKERVYAEEEIMVIKHLVYGK